MKKKHLKNGTSITMKNSKYYDLYREMCSQCPNAKKCHDDAIECDEFLKRLETPKRKVRDYKTLTHQEKMQCYNNNQFGNYYIKDICEQLNITTHSYHKAVDECKELIKRVIKNEYDPKPTTCNLCGGQVIFNKCTKEKSNSGFVYYCTNCHAWVGTYPHDPLVAMGQLANHDTRKKRVELHRWFDKLWKNHAERQIYYSMLAKELGVEEAHFAQMNDDQLQKAEKVIKKWWFEKYDI